MKQNYSAREAGDKIFIGFAENKNGEIFKKIYGPVTINQTNLTVCHDKGCVAKVTITYKINSLSTESYYDRVCFDTWEQAIEYADQEIVRLTEEARKKSQ